MSKSALHRKVSRLLRSATAEIQLERRNIRNISRREAVKNLALMGAGLAFCGKLDLKNLKRSPVVILGGGLAGLSAAYALSRRCIPFVIYEADSRLGGRVLTLKKFSDDGKFAEMGGELLDSNNKEIFHLAKILGFEVEKVREEDKANELFYFGGKFLRYGDLKSSFKKVAAKLEKDQKEIYSGLPAGFINYKNINSAGRKFDNMTLEDYITSFHDIDENIKNILRVAYVSEFGLETSEQTALNMPLLATPGGSENLELYGESDESWRIKGGSSTLVEALAKNIEKYGQIHLGHKLESIKYEDKKFQLNFQKDNTTETVSASQIICTIPFAALKNIGGISEIGLSERKLNAINKFRMGTNSKYFAEFRTAFWNNKDTPKDKRFKISMMTDLPAQMIWDTGHLQNGSHAVLTNFFGGSLGRDSQDTNLTETLQQLDKIYSGIPSRELIKKAGINWSKIPTALGSYVCPTPGNYASFIGSLDLPECGGNLLFAGEHVSEAYLGYMNGAVETGLSAGNNIKV
jgi:monoamine oxidase